MAERHDIILGAGLAGLTAAHTLRANGEDHWLVLEKESTPGGHARSRTVDGYVFDLGPHILFTTDAEIEAMVRRLLGDNLREQERRALIYHGRYGIHTRFPFQAHLHGLPLPVVHRCLADLVRAIEARAAGTARPRNYEEWMRATFGNAIADELMIPYARKLWTVEPSAMDFTWIERRVPVPDFDRILLGALTDDVEQIGSTAQFWYPWRGGIEALPRALAEETGPLELSREVRRIDLRRRIVTVADGDEFPFDRLVFTLPLHSLPTWVDELPTAVRQACEDLAYQSILNLNLGVARPDLSDAHWVYFYEDEFPFHRLSFPANFSPYNVPQGKSSVSIEIALSPSARVDAPALERRTIEALRRARILGEDDEIEFVDTLLISPAYVIYDLRHAQSVATVTGWLREHGIVAAGRFGSWGYLNMDQAMRSGLEAARTILATRR